MRRSGPLDPAGDRHWRGSARFAASCALVFCAVSLLVDWDSESVTPLHALLWGTLSAAVFTVLPPRVTAGTDWLAVRALPERSSVPACPWRAAPPRLRGAAAS